MTGLGVVSPIGVGAEAFWRALIAGRDAVAPFTIFDATRYRTRIAQTVCEDARGPGDPAVAFALRAAEEALTHAGLDAAQRPACGLAVATTAAGWTAGQRLFEAYQTKDHPSFESLLEHPEALLKEGTLWALAARFSLEGPCALLSPACAAASSAIAWAAQRVRDGDCDLMLAGATDALTEVVFAGFHAMRLLAEDACRPFSAGRRGLVLSEGAAFLVLENAAHARASGANVLAQLGGWGLSCDASHPTTPASDGMLRAMKAAIEDARLQPEDVGQISAHGTGSVANDAAEATAIASLLAERVSDVPVTAVKGTLGHTEGAAGAFAAVAGVLSLQHGARPPLGGYTGADAGLPRLRLATTGAEPHPGRNVLVNASGFGGVNVSLFFERPLPSATGQLKDEPGRRSSTRHAVVTSIVALTGRDGSLAEPDAGLCWPGGRSLPLDRVCGLVLTAAQNLLGASESTAVDPAVAVILGTSYGSQARHERIWAALAQEGPRGVDPNDFALSTFNAPGAALAGAYGFGGANLIFLGGASGAAAIDEATRQIVSGRASRVLTGAYDELTPYFRRVLAGLGTPDASETVVLLVLEDAAQAQQRGAASLASILGFASRCPRNRWPDSPDLAETTCVALREAAVETSDVSAVVLDPNQQTRSAQLEAARSLFGPDVTLVDLTPRYGNSLAASAPLALDVAIESARRGSWPDGSVLRGVAAIEPGRPVLINACGLMAGCASLVVTPHGL